MAADSGPRTIYLGGPVDYATHGEDSWQHWPIWSRLGRPICPRCLCKGMADESIIDAVYRHSTESDIAVFDLRTHTIGTPIEMYWRVWQQERKSVIIAKEGSVFIRETARRFDRSVWIGTQITQAPYIVQEILVPS